jgi:Fanconi anemia group I protein
LDSLPHKTVARICNDIFIELNSNVRDNCEIIDILPKCLSMLYSCDQLVIDKKSTSGKAFTSSAISKLIQMEWNPNRTIKIASILKEIPLQDVEFEQLLNKLFKELYQVAESELPPLIYQLLVLSTKGKKKEIILGILKLFQRRNDAITERSSNIALEKLRSVEAVNLQVIELAVKQDQNLGKELLKLLKEDSLLISTFSVSFLLIVSSVPALTTEVHRFVKTTVDSAFKDSLRTRYFQNEEMNEYTDEDETAERLVGSLLEIVKILVSKREFLAKSIVDLGLYLLDTKRITKHPGGLVFSQKEFIHDCHGLGKDMLSGIFSVDYTVRPVIIEQVFNRIVVTHGNSVDKYTELLYYLIRNNSSAILSEQLTKFKESIEYFSYFEPATAQAFFEAVGPLVRTNADFQDSVFLVLRKALYSRELDSRLIALNGFLQILRSSAPAYAVASSSRARSVVSGIDQEILGILRRCLTQQEVIRKRLYEGLFELSEIKSELKEEIQKIFLYHMKEYITPNDIKFDKCIVNGAVNEPLPYLFIYSIRLALSDRESASLPLYSYLEEIISNLYDTTLENAELSKVEFVGDTDSGRNHQMLAGLTIGIEESFLEFILVSDAVEDFETMASNSIDNILKDKDLVKKGSKKKATGEKGKGKSTAATLKFNERNYIPLLSLDVTIRLLDMIIKIDIEETRIQSYTMDLCKQQMAHYLSLVQKRRDYLTPYKKAISNVGQRLLTYALTYCKKNSKQNDEEEDKKKKKKKSKSFASLALECFEEGAKIMSTCDKASLASYLGCALTSVTKKKHTLNESELSSNVGGEGLRRSSVFSNIVHTLATKISQSFQQFEAYEEATKIIELCISLCYLVPIGNLPTLIEWCQELCERDCCMTRNGNFVKNVFKFYILLLGLIGDLSPIEHISNDLKNAIGELIGQREIKESHHKLIGPEDSETANEIVTVFIECMNEFIQYLSWKLERVKQVFTEVNTLREKKQEEMNEIAKEKATAASQMEKMIFEHTAMILIAMPRLSLAPLELHNYEKLNPLIVSIVKFLQSATKYQLFTVKEGVSTSFTKMTEKAGSWIKTIFLMIKSLDQYSSENKAQLERARKAIPDIFYQITEYTQNLSELSKASAHNLLANFEKVPARQFKYTGTLDDEEEEDDDDKKKKKTKKTKAPKKENTTTARKRKKQEEEEDEEDNEPSKKKQRKSK